MSAYIKEIWEREELIRFFADMNWENLRAAVEASRDQEITVYRKNGMYYFPEQV